MQTTSIKAIADAQIREHFTRWRTALGRHDVDRQLTELSIDMVAERLGLAKPAVFWCQSYYQMVYMPYLIGRLLAAPEWVDICQRLEHLELDSSAWRDAWEQGWKYLWQTRASAAFKSSNVPEQFDCLRQPLETRLQEQLRRAVSSGRLPLTADSSEANIYGYPLPTPESSAGKFVSYVERFDQSIKEAIDHVSYSQAEWHGWKLIKEEQDRVNLRRFAEAGIANMLSTDLGGIFTPHSSWVFSHWRRTAWLATAELLLQVLPFQFERVSADLRPLINIANGCWTLLWSGNRVFVCEKPQTLVTDVQGRLHADDGPAFECTDGVRVFAWQGIAPINENIILHPETITFEQIEEEHNATLRWLLISKYGPDRFSQRYAEPVHVDQYGALYRHRLSTGEPVLLLAVWNATPEADGSKRAYYLRVPPDMVTAKQAVAWTFGMTEDEYGPAMET